MGHDHKVYMHINNINGKKYVGITRQKPENRWREYEAKTPIGAAFRKYGRENFTSMVLLWNLTKEEAEEIEISLIACFHTLTTEWGYNIEHGGSARGKVADETKEKIRQSQKRRWKENYEEMYVLTHNPETSKKRSNSLKKVYSDTNLGEQLSKKLKDRWANPEYKAKMSKRMEKNAWNLKPVICEGIEYLSISDFARKNNLTEEAVSSWLSGKRTMPDEWYDKGLSYKEFPNDRKKRSKSGKYEIGIDGNMFTKISDASKYLGVGDGTLGRYLNGRRKIPKSLLDRGFYIKVAE